ncbi:hypothetical protein S7711_11022 [Stachybotrys chartarum IBT 7711]|uniref:Uncharacterized protein n=1 Tax=Stachybotrys chartarum (strain CBS 109288 / IBT 7711) TaxID=1280523 RepID=A0A084B4X3_STACB|nr:hypothetical protein S7711_11022 [Stachybotrys chartarum IBT 7711]
MDPVPQWKTQYVRGVNDADNELFIRTDHYQQERDDDITGRPDFEPVEDRGSVFIPMEPEQRPACLEPLPASPIDLFREFVPVFLVEQWVSYTNEAPEPPRSPGPGPRNNSNYRSSGSVHLAHVRQQRDNGIMLADATCRVGIKISLHFPVCIAILLPEVVDQ